MLFSSFKLRLRFDRPSVSIREPLLGLVNTERAYDIGNYKPVIFDEIYIHHVEQLVVYVLSKGYHQPRRNIFLLT